MKTLKQLITGLGLATDSFKKTGQFSLFGRVDLPSDVYVENWTDINVPYTNPKETTVSSELTVGKTFVGKLAVEGQVAYNVNIPGFQGRAGLRYDF